MAASGKTGRRGPTRRQFVAGAAAAGAATIALASMTGCGNSGTGEQAGTPQVVDDGSQAIHVTEDYAAEAVLPEASATYTLPLGTVLFHSEGSYAAAMQISDTAATPNTIGVMSLANGTVTTLLSTPTQGAQHEFFDVRCSDGVFAWVEANYSDRSWKLMAQPFASAALSGSAVQLDEGTADYDPPRFCVSGSSVIWLFMPNASGTKATEHSFCRMWTVGDDKGVQIWDSPGRFATAPRVSAGILTIAPRVREDEGQYYGMTALDLTDSNRTQIDQLVLPQSVRPMEATYMGNRFAFCIEATYSSRGLLGEMGTYIGREGGPYVTVSSEPLACVAGNGSRYFVKSQTSHLFFDTDAQTYGRLTAPSRALSYGDYPASEGTTSRFVTYATVRDAKTGMPGSVVARVFDL